MKSNISLLVCRSRLWIEPISHLQGDDGCCWLIISGTFIYLFIFKDIIILPLAGTDVIQQVTILRSECTDQRD